MPAVAFEEAKHPRGEHGRFSGGGSVHAVAHALRLDEHSRDRSARMSTLGHKASAIIRDGGPANDDHTPPAKPMGGEGRPLFEAKRSNIKGSSAWTTGSKIAELPVSYTGSKERELPTGSFTHHQMSWQIPKAKTVEEHKALVGKLTRTIEGNREGTAAKGHERGLIPEGTPKHHINRAFNHGALLAMHAFGVGDYDFRMDDHLKAEMEPLKGFIRLSERRNRSELLGQHKGEWRPYRAEFGQKFPKPKFDRATGAERLRVRPNAVLIKADGFEEDRHPRGECGRFASAVAFANKNPETAATLASAAALPVLSLGRDAASFALGRPLGGGVPLSARVASAIGGALGKPFDANSLASHVRGFGWRSGLTATQVHGAQGHGRSLGRFMAGMNPLSDNHVAGIDALTNERVGMNGETPAKLWRGTSGRGADNLRSLKAGQTVTIDPQSSWTRSSKVASKYTRYDYTKATRTERMAGLMMGIKTGKTDQKSLLDATLPDNVKADAPKARVVLRGMNNITSMADIERTAVMPGPQQEVLLGRGTKMRIDKVRDSKAGRVIFATAMKQNPVAAFRRSALRRLVSPALHAGRIVGGLALGTAVVSPLVGMTRGWLWGKKPDRMGKAFDVAAPANPNVLPAQQGVSRFDRYRKALAMSEQMGKHSMKPLTYGQKAERKKAGLDERMKVRSGAPKLMAGMPGSIAGDHLDTPAAGLAGPKLAGLKLGASARV